MAGMIRQRELVLDDLADQWRSPDAGFEAVIDQGAVQNIAELLALLLRQAAGPATAMAFPQPLLAIAIPVLDPKRHCAVMHFELVGDVAGGVSVQTHENALHPQEQARGFFPLGLSVNLQKIRDGLTISFGKYRAHICPAGIPACRAMSNYLCADI